MGSRCSAFGISIAQGTAGALECPDRLGKRLGDFQMGILLLVVLVLLIVGAAPRWGHSRNWGYAPSGGLGLVVMILLILVLLGRI